MKKLITLLSIIPAILLSCSDGLVEKVASTYPNGLPSKIEYFKMEGDSQVLVKHVRFYNTGEKQEEGGFLGNERNGRWTYWHENGNKWSEASYKNGILHGKSTVWFDNGKIRYTGNYINGKTDGVWTYYATDGSKVKEMYFQNGELIEEKSFE
jgi:antitoxin component YwqK of YwqJK toxin-antitoxin module